MKTRTADLKAETGYAPNPLDDGISLRAAEGLGRLPPTFWEYPTPSQWWHLPLRTKLGEWVLWSSGVGLFWLMARWDLEMLQDIRRLGRHR